MIEQRRVNWRDADYARKFCTQSDFELSEIIFKFSFCLLGERKTSKIFTRSLLFILTLLLARRGYRIDNDTRIDFLDFIKLLPRKQVLLFTSPHCVAVLTSLHFEWVSLLWKPKYLVILSHIRDSFNHAQDVRFKQKNLLISVKSDRTPFFYRRKTLSKKELKIWFWWRKASKIMNASGQIIKNLLNSIFIIRR